MAISLTKACAYGIRHEGATRSHAEQVMELHVTALATDVTYDLGVTAGTFWASAVANATYGGLAGQARSFLLSQISGAVTGCFAIQSQVLGAGYVRVAGAPGAATEYRVTAPSVIPTIAFNAAGGPTSIVLRLSWRLKDGQEPRVIDLGGQV